MGYKYETHLHTSNSSACGHSRASEYISYYKEMGYAGIFVTDHFFLGNTCIDRSLPWTEWVSQYCAAYREAYEEGLKQDFPVFFGWEATYQGDDYLVYGLDEAWLMQHPEVTTWTVPEQYRVVHAAGGLVIQAHPFRERGYMNSIHLHPYDCDGWEVANAGNESYQDALAYRYAGGHGMKMTAGSDIHRVDGTNSKQIFGMEFDTPLTSALDYVHRFLNGDTGKPIYPKEWVDPSNIHETELPIYFHHEDGSITNPESAQALFSQEGDSL